MRHLRVSLALAAVVGALTTVAAPAYADDDNKLVVCSAITSKNGQPPTNLDTQLSPAPQGGSPLDIMGIDDAQQEVGSPGHGTSIALIDSGVDGGAKKGSFAGKQAPAKDYHGTVSAGLIQEIAPQAQLTDYPVVKVESNGEKQRVMTDAMASALEGLAGGRTKHLVVAVAVGVDDGSPRLQSAVEKLEKKGAIVVASANWTGASPSTEPDLKGEVFPAAYDGVVVASASHTTASDGNNTNTPSVLPNSDTTIAAPVWGAPSRTLFSTPCWVDSVNTGWAAAEVSAVMALVWSRYPNLSATEITEKVYGTASGREGSGGRYTGAGIVQAYDAVTEQVESVKPKTEPTRKAELGHPPTDVLANVRKHAVWWGLGGGGALLLGLVMRPLFARLRKKTG